MTGVVTVSPKYQVVIPKETRNRMQIKPGTKIVVLERWDQIIYVKVRPIKELRGIAKGISLDGIRDEKDRL